jgi:hypothetical protein
MKEFRYSFAYIGGHGKVPFLPSDKHRKMKMICWMDGVCAVSVGHIGLNLPVRP